MTRPLLVLRPEPGNAATCARATAMRLEAIACPLFAVEARRWDAPEASGLDGVLLTSANAVRHAGAALKRYLRLPAYAVGAATAAAARETGFEQVIAGGRDVAALVASLPARSLLHLAGADRTAFEAGDVQIETCVVYESVVLPEPPGLAAALGRHPVALLHSARAAERFAELAVQRSHIALVAISAAVGQAAGDGWEQVAVSPEPRDEAMLALAAHIQGSR